MNIDANYIINQIKPGISEDDINKIINDYLASLGIDSQEEIDEVTEELFPDIEAKIAELETSLTDLKKTLSGDLSSEESRVMGNNLLDDLEAKISDLETLSNSAHDEIDQLSQNIFDGTNGQQVAVSYDNTMFNADDNMDPLIINLGNGSANYLDDLATDTATQTDDDGITNYDDLKTSKDWNELQQIALDFSSLEGSLTSVSSYDESSGRLVLKTELPDGTFKITEIRNFNAEKHALLINGQFTNDSNRDHWENVVPEAVTKAIYPNEGEGTLNLYDNLPLGGVPIWILACKKPATIKF